MDKNQTKKWISLCGIALLAFTAFLDCSIVNTCLALIQKDLNANMSQLQWVINGLVLALTVCSPIMGIIGDIYGRKTILYIDVIIFALSSAGAGISLGMNELIMFRIVQGVACAVLLTLSFSIVSDIFGPEHHGKALAVFGGITGTGLASGPVIGGIIASTIGWRYIFFINLPITLIGLLICSFGNVPNVKTVGGNSKIDYLGSLLLIISLTGLILGILEIEATGFNQITYGYFACFILGAVWFIKHENNHSTPIVDLHLFKNSNYVTMVTGAFLCGGSVTVTMFFMPLFLSSTMNLLPYLVGLIMFSITGTEIVATITTGHIINRCGPNQLILGASFLLLCSSIFFHLVDTKEALIFIIIASMLVGFSWGTMNVAPPVSISKYLLPNQQGSALGSFITFWNLGAVICLALCTTIFQIVQRSAIFKSLKLANINIDISEKGVVNKIIMNPKESKILLSKFTTNFSTEILPILHNAFIEGMQMVFSFMSIFSITALLIINMSMKKCDIKNEKIGL